MPDSASGTDAIIKTAIARPPLRKPLHRPRLYERLDSGASRKLTVISAPAGYGKTTLVSSWLAERSLDYCWVNLGALDGSAQRMTRYLAAALNRLEHRKGLLESNQWVAFLNNLAERQHDTILVLDDYQLAATAEVNDLVIRLLENLPPMAHLVIITRVDPMMRLAKLRGQDELVELRESDLAFTLEECKEFLTDASGVSLTRGQVRSLWHGTEGWIAGLQIMASSLKNRADASNLIGDLNGRRRYLHDYLVEEVVSRLDPTTRDFLERCSILERLSVELCDAVTGRTDSREMLSAIDRQNLFVSPLDEEQQWFRLHHLFAEVLLARLREGHPEELPVLHGKASEWFDAHSYYGEAISHRVASGDAATAADLINRHARWLMKQGELMTVKRWLSSLPEDVCVTYPAIMLLRAWAGIMDGRPLSEIERGLDSAEQTGEYRALALCLRSYIAGLQGDDEQALRLSRQALGMADEQDLFVIGHARFRIAIGRLVLGEVTKAIEMLELAADESLRAGNLPVVIAALAHKARVLVDRGELDSGEEAYQRALNLAIPPDGSRKGYIGWALIGLGEINRLRGSIENALGLFREGMEASQDLFDLNSFSISLGLVVALLAKSLEAEALEALASAEQRAHRFGVPLYFIRLVEAYRSLVLLRGERLQEARARLKETHLSATQGSQVSYLEWVVSDLEILVRARVALLERNPRGCIDLALPVANRARRQGRGLHALNADLILVRAYWHAEQIDEAMSILGRGLSFAAERGIVQPFVDEGPELARILYRARTLGLSHPFIGKLLAAFPLDEQSTAAAQTQPHSVEPLSTQEVKVLTLLSQGLSNKEVAAKVYLSVRTVRWHASNIYSKLGVSSRTQAIVKARQLGILPQ